MLPIKDPVESVVVTFNFTGEMPAISVAAVAVSVHKGQDPDPSAVLFGPPQVSGTEVRQRVKNGLSGVTYRLRCVATNGDDVIVRADLMTVKTFVS